MNKFRRKIYIPQYDLADCGPACLKMIAQYYGKTYSLEYLREICYIGREGVSLLNINDAAESLGFRTYMAYLTPERLIEDCPLPTILHWNQDHFIVLYGIKRKKYFTIADPAHGIVTIDRATFLKAWVSTYDGKGVALLLEPTPKFYSAHSNRENKRGYKLIFRYLKPFKKYLLLLIIGMLITSIISLAFPYITQLLIDEGINKKNIPIVYLVLFSQFALFLGSTVMDLLRGWLMLHLNTRISLNIISDFLIKLLKLPISFFDSKAVGDLSQRINDHHRIENFLTGTTISSIFSVVNIVVFTVILAFYHHTIVLLFLSFSLIGVIWILLFQKKRKQLDYKRFARSRETQDKLYEFIVGMQEIKLYGSETYKRWEWERLQIKFFRLNVSTLALEQWQQAGFVFLSTLKNILISFVAANEVIKGNITLGALLSISYIIGQTNGPISQLIGFFKSAQDARLSMDRLQEIHEKQGEEEHEFENGDLLENLADLHIENVSFQYEGPQSPFVLKNVCLTIPGGKVTAIVGASGSGKTTLMKLLLGFYKPVDGKILVGDNDLNSFSPKLWRSKCGTVMQGGYIFYDTIARNIAIDGREISDEKMQEAVRIANLQEYIAQLSLGYTTKIGASGIGISGGEQQRILIARAVYKNPYYLFFDEATSNLDATNEKEIMDSLSEFFQGRTVLIIAHRLSTVKNADQIIVLKKGQVVEVGNHASLTEAQGIYYELVKNQLELGK